MCASFFGLSFYGIHASELGPCEVYIYLSALRRLELQI